jgi:hypothetical protein
MTRLLAALALVLAVLSGVAPACAHEIRPALFEARAQGADLRLFWKQPVQGEVALGLHPVLSNGLLDQPPAEEVVTADHLARTWLVRNKGPDALQGARFGVVGLERSITSVIVHVDTEDGRSRDFLLTPAHPEVVLDVERPGGLAVAAYFGLGVNHILTGIDHLSFVFGLLLLIGPSLRLFKAITAFTLAHSITLALVALGFIAPPPALIEALVALSILFLAVEIVRKERGGASLTIAHPWIIAFAFGLLHGCAFAGALAEVGLPKGEVVPALLLFNLGVEAGQIAFILAALAVGFCLRRLPWTAVRRTAPRLGAVAEALPVLGPVYLIGSVSALWVIERAVLLLS